MLLRSSLAVLFLFIAIPSNATTYYIKAAGGNDTNDGLTSGNAWATFVHAWTVLSAGDTLLVVDGTYAANPSPPEGVNGSAGSPITVKAENDGAAILQVGIRIEGNSYLTFEGLTIKADVPLYVVSDGDGAIGNPAHHNSFKRMGFKRLLEEVYGSVVAFGDGAHHNLVEDSWVWGKGRYKVSFYGGNGGADTPNLTCDNNILRRVVIRFDAHTPTSGQPQSGFVWYYASSNVAENVIIIDGLQDSGSGTVSSVYATCGSSFGATQCSSNRMLGSVILNNTAHSFYVDVAESGIGRFNEIRESVVYPTSSSYHGIVTNATPNATAADTIAVHNTVRGAFRGIGAGEPLMDVYDNLLVGNTEGLYRSTDGGSFDQQHHNHFFSNTSNVVNTTLQGTDITTDPAQLYLVRIEDGTPGKGTASDGGDRGATVIYRYGLDGTFYGDTGYDSLTVNNLWPWPNEARIFQELCTDESETRGFCSSASLTDYIWGYLGNGVPGSDPPIIATTNLPNGQTTVAYSQEVQVTGGVVPFASCAITAGALPDGLSIALNGTSNGCTISGTPTVANTFNFTVTVTDGDAPGVTDDQALSIVITAGAPTLTLRSPIVLESDTAVIVTTGAFGLPFEADCTFVLRNVSGQQLSSQTSTSGFAVRTTIFTSLTAATNYRVDVGCDSSIPDVIQYEFTTLATPTGGARTVPLSLNPSAILASVNNVIIEYDDNAALSTPATAGPTSCASGCTPTLSLTAGIWWYRIKWRDVGNNVLATSTIQTLLVE